MLTLIAYSFLSRDSLISTIPFLFYQVRFFYSFTSSENLYLVMEYLGGGDFYSLLKNIGCMDESNARVYIAEVVSDHAIISRNDIKMM